MNELKYIENCKKDKKGGNKMIDKYRERKRECFKY